MSSHDYCPKCDGPCCLVLGSGGTPFERFARSEKKELSKIDKTEIEQLFQKLSLQLYG